MRILIVGGEIAPGQQRGQRDYGGKTAQALHYFCPLASADWLASFDGSFFSATLTASPSDSESGGLAMMRSPALIPEAISTSLPKSRPIWTLTRCALLCSSILATCSPSARKISALTGRRGLPSAIGRWKCTWA